MARICAVCGKRPQVANLVSNANNRVRRWVFPNVHVMRFTMPSRPDGKVTRGCVCAKCRKSGKVEKVL
jgi:large subunit ribosomal protein L28